MRKILHKLVAIADAADAAGLTRLANDLDNLTRSVIDETKTSPSASLSSLPNWEVNGGYNNIIALLRTATSEEVDYWRNWYSNARRDVEVLADKYKEPFNLVAAVVAVLSPGNNWASNLRAAENILLEVHDEKTYNPSVPSSSEVSDSSSRAVRNESAGNVKYRSVPAYPANSAKARNILITGKPEEYVLGPKVTVFYESLVNPKATEDHMVLDGHAINIWRGVRVPLKGLRSPTAAERNNMIRDYGRAAADTGLSVQEIQALTWFLWKTAQE